MADLLCLTFCSGNSSPAACSPLSVAPIQPKQNDMGQIGSCCPDFSMNGIMRSATQMSATSAFTSVKRNPQIYTRRIVHRARGFQSIYYPLWPSVAVLLSCSLLSVCGVGLLLPCRCVVSARAGCCFLLVSFLLFALLAGVQSKHGWLSTYSPISNTDASRRCALGIPAKQAQTCANAVPCFISLMALQLKHKRKRWLANFRQHVPSHLAAGAFVIETNANAGLTSVISSIFLLQL